ncbi:hypothetical protein [Lentzea albida]|uniref:DUF3558 domain-containing protein n=1 Tax=Lentzea albida TaxID=65499 RepID=A0A1H9XF00_9PSEU|nr:hypothetical protein [Lentzea albida]SES44750.1 hypothetical protein SAMN04488000_13436 [Lentzea albida]
MRNRIAGAVALVLVAVGGCGADVPDGLAQKVAADCPGLVEPEPLAVVTQGFVVSQISSEAGQACKVWINDGREVLLVSLIAHASEQEAVQRTAGLCDDMALDEPDKSCAAAVSGNETYALHGVAGRWEARITVYEILVGDDAKDAVHQMLEDLRKSEKTKS